MAEAQTLTYNPNEQVEGELTTEEKESLEVGEKLAEAQGELLYTLPSTPRVASPLAPVVKKHRNPHDHTLLHVS